MLTYSDIVTIPAVAIPMTDAQRAAAKIRAEGRLGTGILCDDDGLRCGLAIIFDSQSDGSDGPSRLLGGADLVVRYHQHWGQHIYEDNNGFVGTPEERAEYMARKVEALDQSVTAG